jgi:hypothetical protein
MSNKNLSLEEIERKQLEILHIAELQEKEGKRAMKENEKQMLVFLENKYYGEKQ